MSLGVPLSLQAVISDAVIAVILNPESSNVIGLIDSAKQPGVD